MRFRPLKNSLKISEVEIQKMNALLKFEIPQSYQEFIIENNCVAPEYQYFVISKDDFVRFKYFLGINEKEFIYDLYSAYINYKDRIPDDLFQIADTGGENIICMGYRGANKGKIFYCAIGDVVNKVSYEDGSVSKIADSLDEVLNNLVEDPE